MLVSYSMWEQKRALAELFSSYEDEHTEPEGTIRELFEQITQKTDKTINIYRFMKLVR